MKTLSILLLCLNLCSLSAQVSIPLTCWGVDQSILPEKPARVKYNWRRAIAPASLCFVSGAAWGIHEKTMHHWGVFQQRFPGAKPRYWNPAVSWTNKYTNWPEDKTRRRVPVVFTDAKHLLASTTQVTAFAAGACITLGENRPWWHYAIDLGISFGAYSAGNYLTFNALYR